ncbi:MAG: HU family DNA-binding protein [Firmicutes bacterium]|nr:HU family DNA-binding protein [Bacillota bacterium]
MKKQDFVNQLSEKINLPKKITNDIVDEFSALIMQSLKSGDEVGLSIGKFQLKKRDARIGTNPLTGQRIVVAPKVVPSFKPSKTFKTAVLE